jgi:hypothetical protein
MYRPSGAAPSLPSHTQAYPAWANSFRASGAGFLAAAKRYLPISSDQCSSVISGSDPRVINVIRGGSSS